MTTPTSKVCKTCRVEKPLAEFHRAPRGKFGVLAHCGACTCERVRALRAKNHEHYLAFDRQRSQTPERRAQWRTYSKAKRQREPEKIRARAALNHAVRDGKLTRQPCEGCGTTVRVHGHHHDYSKTLEVRWLCVTCHAAEHAAERRAA